MSYFSSTIFLLVLTADSESRELLEWFIEGAEAYKPSSFLKILSTCSGSNSSIPVLSYPDLILASVKVLSKVR
jgi:hypothetical protein